MLWLSGSETSSLPLSASDRPTLITRLEWPETTPCTDWSGAVWAATSRAALATASGQHTGGGGAPGSTPTAWRATKTALRLPASMLWTRASMVVVTVVCHCCKLCTVVQQCAPVGRPRGQRWLDTVARAERRAARACDVQRACGGEVRDGSSTSSSRFWHACMKCQHLAGALFRRTDDPPSLPRRCCCRGEGRRPTCCTCGRPGRLDELLRAPFIWPGWSCVRIWLWPIYMTRPRDRRRPR